MERICEYCEATFARPPSHSGPYCSKQCAYKARRKDRTGYRRLRRHPDHPLAGKTGLVAESRALLYDLIGAGPHRCHWCGADVVWMVGKRGNLRGALVVDHLNSDPMDDRPENLVAACGPCNAQRARTVRDGEQYVTRANGTRLRVGEERACRTCGCAFRTTVPHRHYCSRTCVRKKPPAC